jgi:primosomal protein N' (replication factor Y)
VLIQTRNPAHPAIALAVLHDLPAFVERELADRKELNYPPFSRIALVRIDAQDERVAREASERLAAIAKKAAPGGVEIVGPAAAPIARLRNRFRYRFMVRAPSRAPLRQVLVAVARAPSDRRVRAIIDVDPVSML